MIRDESQGITIKFRVGGDPHLCLFLSEVLQIQLEGLLDGVLGDEAHEVADIRLPGGQQLIDGGLPHRRLGDLPGVI